MSSTGKGSSPGRGEISPEDREAIRGRSSEIGKQLSEVKARRAAAEPVHSGARGAAMARAFRLAAELVVGVGVGGVIGWALDRLFGTTPWLLVLFVILGFAAGMLNVIRVARSMQAEAEASQLAAPSVPDDEDDR